MHQHPIYMNMHFFVSLSSKSTKSYTVEFIVHLDCAGPGENAPIPYFSSDGLNLGFITSWAQEL